jgi:hypothetical protein
MNAVAVPPPDIYTALATIAHGLRLTEWPEGSGVFRAEGVRWSIRIENLWPQQPKDKVLVFGGDELRARGGKVTWLFWEGWQPSHAWVSFPEALNGRLWDFDASMAARINIVADGALGLATVDAKYIEHAARLRYWCDQGRDTLEEEEKGVEYATVAYPTKLSAGPRYA